MVKAGALVGARQRLPTTVTVKGKSVYTRENRRFPFMIVTVTLLNRQKWLVQLLV